MKKIRTKLKKNETQQHGIAFKPKGVSGTCGRGDES